MGDETHERDPRLGRFRFSGSLRQRAARGTIVNSAFLVGISGLGLIRGLVLAAFIAVTDYGTWGILVIAIGTLLSLKQAGVADKFIQQDEADQEAAFQKAFTLDFALTVVFVVVVAALLPAIEALYGVDGLVLPGLVILATFVIATFQAPLWIFYRRMEFARQRLLQAVEPIVGLIVAVGLAIAGAGYWSFVVAFIVGHAAMAIACVVLSPYRIRLRFDRETARSYLTFSWPLFLASGSALMISQAAVLTARWQIGLAATGVVTLASNVSAFADRVDTVITGTLYPAICAVKDRPALLFESFVKSNRLALMWAVPAGGALALFAPDLVHFGIGEEWTSAIVVMQVYGVIAAVNHVGFNWTAYFRAQGKTKPIAVTAAASMLAFVAAVVPLTGAFGLPGFAAAVGIQAAAGIAVRTYYLTRIFDGFNFFFHAVRAFLPSLCAASLILGIRGVVGVDRTIGHALAELALYAVITAWITWRLERELLQEAGGYLRPGLGVKEVAPGRPAPVAVSNAVDLPAAIHGVGDDEAAIST